MVVCEIFGKMTRRKSKSRDRSGVTLLSLQHSDSWLRSKSAHCERVARDIVSVKEKKRARAEGCALNHISHGLQCELDVSKHWQLSYEVTCIRLIDKNVKVK